MIPRIMVLLDPARGYDRALMRGMSRCLHAEGGVVFFSPPPVWERWDGYALVDYIREAKIDGLVMLEKADMTPFQELGIPMVVSPYLQRRVAGAVNISTDHEAIGRMAAETLLARGIRNFAFCGYSDMFWSQDRLKGFRGRLAEAGCSADCFAESSASPMDERVRLMRWLTELPQPVGMMACVDERGREVAELALSCGIRIPDGISLMGVDDDELLCDFSPVPLSSIAISAERAGEEAVRRLVAMVQARRPRLKPDIAVEPLYCVERLSTDFINIEDPAVARALRFIRANARGIVGVDDVVRAAGVSRRVLEKRFRSRLGISISREIRRGKITLFTQMLAESSRSVSDIADAVGFPGIEHVSRYFKAETGMTPREYRNRYSTG